MVSGSEVYLGFDFSTQQLKSVIVNNNREIQCEASVKFDTDLPEFRTHNGVVRSAKKTVTSPVLMWVKALDMVLEKLRISGADFSKVVAVSGCAQQHGTVYWAIGAEDVLSSLTDEFFLHTQLASCFSVNHSPVWLDSSTKNQCIALETAVGGCLELAKITGSRAYERYSSAQISKIWGFKPTVYKNTERISLISSFACSIFLGRYSPIDLADGSGMNLLDITTKNWCTKCVEATAPELEEKLGKPVPTNTFLGKISSYFSERFGFNEDCKIFAFTGDNPSSLAGMRLRDNDIGLSLGTSDTLFMWLKEPKILNDGHVLVNPVASDEYMALFCFKNGSLIRERINHKFTVGSWTEFNKLLESTPRGNFGFIGLFYDVEEIVPKLEGVYRYDRAGNTIDKFPSPEIEIRALIEGQFLAKKALVEQLNLGNIDRIIVTGGASENISILQVISDVFAVPVYKLAYANSAALGAAFRAMDCYSNNDNAPNSADQRSLDNSHLSLVCKPFDDCKQIYSPMVARYLEIVENLLARKVN